MYTIIGAGLAGLSASYHLGHDNCLIFEKNSHAGGHIHSETINGFTWDEGPHVSFTKHQYVKDLFAKSVEDDYLEYPVYPTNYFQGNWIPHPAQSNLYALPEAIKAKCLIDFLSSRDTADLDSKPANYQEWLDMAFGKTFSEIFPTAYTEKYWTLSPDQLTTEWVGNRVFFPDVETVKAGSIGPSLASTHYITSVRYPSKGGYFSYIKTVLKDANIHFKKQISRIDLARKTIYFTTGDKHVYDKLISTLPLNLFIKYCNAPAEVLKAAEGLLCSEVLLVNVEANHSPTRKEHWLYVYDKDKHSTRINFTDLLSPNNAPEGQCGIQVEVYFSKHKPREKADDVYAKEVIEELIEMGLLKTKESINHYHTKYVSYANVIFDLGYDERLEIIWSYLEQFGLTRERNDIQPMTDWEEKQTVELGDLIFAGRFGQWKYYWTDDCVLRGKFISENIANTE